MSERRGTGPAEQAAKQRAASRGKGAAKSKGPAKSAAKPPANSPAGSDAPQQPQDRGLRRALFLAELAEAKELRKRVAPRRTRAAELHARLLRTFRY
jgi:hypothetical protein